MILIGFLFTKRFIKILLHVRQLKRYQAQASKTERNGPEDELEKRKLQRYSQRKKEEREKEGRVKKRKKSRKKGQTDR